MYRYVVMALMLTAVSFASQASVVIGGTRVIYNEDKNAAAVFIRNPEKSGMTLVQSWVEQGKKEGKAPFIATPPLFRIDPGEENMLRIVRIGGTLPKDRESVFWLNVKSIPAVDARQHQNNVLQLVVKSRLKLFYRPAGLKGRPDTAYQQLSVMRNGNRLTLSNPTPYFVTLFSLMADNREIKEADMVPPKGSVSFTLTSGMPSIITWQAINDYGGISPVERRNL